MSSLIWQIKKLYILDLHVTNSINYPFVSKGFRSLWYIDNFSNIVTIGSSGLLYSSSYSSPTLHKHSKSYLTLASFENMCKAMLPENE